jgi:hypothetical protein
MRYYFLTFGFLIVCSTFIHGQDNKLIYTKQVSNSEEKTNEILQKSEVYTSVEFVEIALEKILTYEQFTLQFKEKIVPICKERIDVRGINNYVFVGSNNEGSRILISVLDEDIQGVIESEKEVFTIETVGENEYAIITVDHSKLREGCENIPEGFTLLEIDNEESHNSHIEHEHEDENENSSPTHQSVVPYDCKVRVLVLYTPSAKSLVSNIKNTVLTAVALTNQSFSNSNINYQIELAYVGQTNYTESGSYSTDLSRFRIVGDGYMDEVHTLRDKYSADVCVLLTNESGICGIAAGIGVTDANAFCVVSTYGTCATSNYSFGHEIGHLLGCRHDPYVDNSTTPFAYGHGYVNPSKEWRTIMAYINDCGSCPRLQYWSNPNVTYGSEPMGTFNTHNNARVWNEQSNTIMAFRQPDNNIIITSSDIPNTQYADIVAKQKITTSGTVNISGNTLNMRSGNSITLQPGFSVATGAEFSAAIENIYYCGSSSLSAIKITIQNVPEENDDITNNQEINKPDFSYKVYPNPTDEFINITYSLVTDMFLSIELVNLFGQKIKTVLPKQNQKTGSYTLQITVSGFSTGTYFLTISSANQTKTEKIIINK